jgi:fatty acid desaturase
MQRPASPMREYSRGEYMNEQQKHELKLAWLKVVAFCVALIFVGLPILLWLPFLWPLLMIAALLFLLAFLKKMLDNIAPPDRTPHTDLTPDDRHLD